MARPTQSYGLYVQQFGRGLRPASGKKYGIIIDHVDNVRRHKLPDYPPAWDFELTDIRKRTSDETVPPRNCVNPECMRYYESYSNTCPYCGHKPEPQERGAPDTVEGDLTEYSPDILDSLRREATRIISEPRLPPGMSAIARAGAINQWETRRETQMDLRSAISLWAGVRRDIHNDDDSTSYKRFFHRFGVDVATACTLSAREAEQLTLRIRDETMKDFKS